MCLIDNLFILLDLRLHSGILAISRVANWATCSSICGVRFAQSFWHVSWGLVYEVVPCSLLLNWLLLLLRGILIVVQGLVEFELLHVLPVLDFEIFRYTT